jgi:malonate transporter
VQDVATGLFVVGAAIAVGYVLARFRVVPATTPIVVGRIVFAVGLPALIFTMIATTGLEVIFTGSTIVSVLSALAVMAVFLLAGVVLRWGGSRTIIGTLSSGLVNSTNLGVPLTTFIFGTASPVTAIILFQMALVTPIALTALDLLAARGRRPTVFAVIATPFKNPVTIAAIAGILVSTTGVAMPGPVIAATTLLSQLCVPTMLLMFGMSLVGVRFAAERRHRGPIALATCLKSIAQPSIAFALGAWVLHLPPASLYTAVVCAILPSAQNPLIYAMRYGVAIDIPRASAVYTTALAVPTLLIVAGFH